MAVAVLGTGKMGGAIARRLASEGEEVVVWNRTRARAEALGVGRVAATAAEAAAAADIVISILTGPEADRETYAGEQGALDVAEGRLFIDMTTGGPDNAIELARLVHEHGGRFLEAPVLGGPPAIESGRLTILVGGDPADLDAARDLLARLGEVRHIGEVGAANRLKLVSNSMLAGGSALAAELQAAAEHAGVSREDAFWAMQRMLPYLDLRKAGYLEQRYEPVFFTLNDLLKDVRLAQRMFDGFDTPILDAGGEAYRAVQDSHGDQDMSAVNARYRL